MADRPDQSNTSNSFSYFYQLLSHWFWYFWELKNFFLPFSYCVGMLSFSKALHLLLVVFRRSSLSRPVGSFMVLHNGTKSFRKSYLKKKYFELCIVASTKGQLISKCPYEKSVSSKYQRKYFWNLCLEIFCSSLGASWKLFGLPVGFLIYDIIY